MKIIENIVSSLRGNKQFEKCCNNGNPNFSNTNDMYLWNTVTLIFGLLYITIIALASQSVKGSMILICNLNLKALTFIIQYAPL